MYKIHKLHSMIYISYLNTNKEIGNIESNKIQGKLHLVTTYCITFKNAKDNPGLGFTNPLQGSFVPELIDNLKERQYICIHLYL